MLLEPAQADLEGGVRSAGGIEKIPLLGDRLQLFEPVHGLNSHRMQPRKGPAAVAYEPLASGGEPILAEHAPAIVSPGTACITR